MNCHSETTNEEPEGRIFWRRQFAGNVTLPQLAYDLIFGIVLPILCLIFDPVVFSGGGFGLDIIPVAQYKWFVYSFSALSIIALAVWLLTYHTARSAAGVTGALIAGILLSGAACSFLIGFLILPLTLLGSMLIVGLLGFIPFFTAFAYLRNGMRALNLAETYVGRPKLVGALLLGAIFVISLPSVAHVSINRMVRHSVNDLRSGDPRAVDNAISRLKWVGWSGSLDDLVWAYSKEQDPTRKQNLARAYKELTGDEIEHRLTVLLD